MTTFLCAAGREFGKAIARPIPPVSSQWRLLPFGLLLLLVVGETGAFGQRLLNVVPRGDDRTLDGWSVEVDHDLVRSAPQRLEFEAPDGRVLTVEMRVFEDRGDGNAMWVGGYPELGYDSVVLTLQDGYLLGRLGLPEGGAYWLRPGDGRAGLLTEGRETSAQACGGGVVPERDPVGPAVAAQRPELPESVASPSNHDRLDILMLYTASAAARLDQAGWGPPGGAMQHAIDYLNLVLRNSQISATARMVHHREAPASLGEVESPLGAVSRDQEVRELRAEHGADLVHLFFNESPGFCGQAWLMTRGDTAANFWSAGYGVTTVAGGCVDAARLVRDGEHASHVETFAHEIGHNLGANHDPDNTIIEPEEAVYPYAYGHHNFTPQPNVKSVMSYNEGRQEPYFSTVRVRPRGYELGVAGQRENERALQQTIRVGVRFSDHLPDPGEPPPPPPQPPGDRPLAPTDVSVIPTGSTSVKVTWTDRSDNEDGFQVHARFQGSGWATVARVPANTESADVGGLRSGGRYDFRVRAFNRSGGRNSAVTTIVLQEADFTDCVPQVPRITFEHGFTVSMCIEYQEGGTGPMLTKDAEDYGLESRESGLLYFFDRDNAEVLVKVLDACAVNGHRWVFAAPVTTLAFNLYVDETATGKRWAHRNPRGGQTATTQSNIQAFPCESSSASRADVGGMPGVELVDGGFPPSSATAAAKPGPAPAGFAVPVAQPVSAGGEADCEPQPVATLRGGYTVNMCVEHVRDGETVVEEVKDYGLQSDQSAILYFFDRDNAEVLIKVLDGCGVNGYRWVFVAPVTTLAYNLTVESPDPAEAVWTHRNSLNQTAAAASNIKAFACR